MLSISLQLESKLFNHSLQGPAWRGLGPGPNPTWTQTVQNARFVCYLRGFNSMCSQPRKTVRKPIQKNCGCVQSNQSRFQAQASPVSLSITC